MREHLNSSSFVLRHTCGIEDMILVKDRYYYFLFARFYG